MRAIETAQAIRHRFATAAACMLALSAGVPLACHAGIFGPEQTYTGGGTFVAAADMNGDGKLDLIYTGTPNAAAGKVLTIRLNETASGASTLSFAAPFSPLLTTFPPLNSAAFALAVDLNGDGLSDLVVSDFQNNAVSVLINTTTRGSADPHFAAPLSFATGDGPAGIASADVDGDGKPDLLIANELGNSISVLLNTTANGATVPAFSTHEILTAGGPVLLATADINGDGLPDMIASEPDENNVSVFLNTTAAAGTPTFSSQLTFAAGAGPIGIAVADMDGDGRPDVIASNFADRTVSVLLNTTAARDAAASFATQQKFAVGNKPSVVAATDINGDGRPDLLVGSADHGGVSLLLNTTQGGVLAVAAQQVFADTNNVVGLAAADLNGDGETDLIYKASDRSVESMLLNTSPRVNLNQHGLTGSWYNPATGGQGFELEVYPNSGGAGKGSLFAGWFTFPRTSSLTARRWYGLTGDVSSAMPTTALQVFDVEGGNLNAPPALGPLGSLGSATLQFSDCNTGSLIYAFTDTDGSARKGTIPLVRLTPNVTCTPLGDSAVPASSYLLSGNWYNPQSSGQGFMFDFNPSINTLFAAWYTFLFHGQQLGGPASQNWFTLQAGNFAPGTTTLGDIPIVETFGGVFDDPTQTTSFQAGTASITLHSCNAMTLSYEFKAGENKGVTGSVDLQRVGPVPAGCSLH